MPLTDSYKFLQILVAVLFCFFAVALASPGKDVDKVDVEKMIQCNKECMAKVGRGFARDEFWTCYAACYDAQRTSR